MSGGSLSGLGGNTSQALRVVDEALGQLTLIEGSVDAFADVTVASAASLLDGLEEQMRLDCPAKIVDNDRPKTYALSFQFAARSSAKC